MPKGYPGSAPQCAAATDDGWRCPRLAQCGGYCAGHYQRVKRHGDARPDEPLRAKHRWPENLLDRLERRPNGCLGWTGEPEGDGYGRVADAGGRIRRVHVLAYELAHGPVPEGKQVDHACHNIDPECPGGPCHHRTCVDPDHLEAITCKENILRGKSPSAVHARKTECIRGHAFTPENTIIHCGGKRACRTCVNDGQRRRTRQRREARDRELMAVAS